jgi:hypothetical protein
MPAFVIEVNDIAVTVHDGDRVLLESPGYALLEDRSLQVGSEAHRRARLTPRQIDNTFWDRLNLEPLSHPRAQARHAADLVYAHLAHIRGRIPAPVEGVLWVTPGSLDRQQLGLLLGIAEECQLPPAGLVDTAVAAALTKPPTDPVVFHLDIQLHRCVLTRLELDTMVRRTRVHQLPGAGLSQLREAWAKAVAAAFVRTTRFDPLHSAATEQRLYDHLTVWLDRLRTGSSADLVLPAGGNNHAITLRRDTLTQAATGIYQRIVQLVRDCAPSGEPLTLQLSHRLQMLPGLTDYLGLLPHLDLAPLAADAAIRGALAQRSLIEEPTGNASRLVTELPRPNRLAAPSRPWDEATKTRDAQPTHLLYRDHAYPITEHPLTVGTDIGPDTPGFTLTDSVHGVSRRHCSVYTRNERAWLDDHSTYGTFLNDRKVSGGAPLRSGDRLRLGTPGTELRLITVKDHP